MRGTGARGGAARVLGRVALRSAGRAHAGGSDAHMRGALGARGLCCTCAGVLNSRAAILFPFRYEEDYRRGYEWFDAFVPAAPATAALTIPKRP